MVSGGIGGSGPSGDGGVLEALSSSPPLSLLNGIPVFTSFLSSGELLADRWLRVWYPGAFS